MGIFSSDEEVYVATKVIKLFDKTPNTLSEDIVAAIIRGDDIGQSIRDVSLKSVAHKFNNYYAYAATNHPNGVAKDDSAVIFPSREAMQAHLQPQESDPVVVTSVAMDPNNYTFQVELYLTNDRGYNRFTKRFSDYNTAYDTAFDNQLQSKIDEVQAEIDLALPGLLSQVPSNSTSEVNTTYQGKAAVEVTEVTVIQNTIQRVKPLEDRHSRLTDINAQAATTGGQISTYDITVESRNIVSVIGDLSVTYKVRTKQYYRTDTQSEILISDTFSDIVSLTMPQVSVKDTLAFTDIDVFTPTPVPTNTAFPLIHVFVEYYTYDTITLERTPKVFYDAYTSVDNIPFVAIDNRRVPGNIDDVRGYFPALALRHNNAATLDLSNPETTQSWYDETINLFNILGIDALALSDSIHESPDINDVDEAYFMLSANVLSDNPGTLHYLSEVFTQMGEEYDRSRESLGNFEEQLALWNAVGQIDVYDGIFNRHLWSFGNGGVNLNVYFTDIDVQYFQGEIGPPDTVKREIYETPNATTQLIFKHQIDKDTYRVTTVKGLQTRNVVYDFHSVETTLENAINSPDDYQLVLPLQYQIVQDMPASLRNEVFFDCASIAFHSYEIVKLRWYETKLFRSILVAVSIVVLITTGIDVYNTYAAFTAIGGTTVGLAYLAMVIVQAIVISVGVDLLIELTSPEIAAIIAAVLLIAGGFSKFGGKNSLIDASWADKLLSASTVIGDTVVSHIQAAIIDIQNDLIALQNDAEERFDELQALRDELGIQGLLNPLLFTHFPQTVNFSETPTQFYARTTTANPGAIGYRVIENYVDMQLTLPTANDTLRGF